MKRLLLVALALVSLQACAGALRGGTLGSATRRPPLQVIAPVHLMLGINDGPAIPPTVAARYCGYGREFVIRQPIKSTADAMAAVDTIVPCARLHGLWLVETATRDLVRALAAFIQAGVRPPPWGIELGNERDLAGDTPAAFGTFVGDARALLRGAGYVGHLVIGAVYTVDNHQPQDFADYLAPALAACPDCDVALHWYGDTSDGWIARVQQLGRSVMVTEFGQTSCTPAQDNAQRVYLQEKVHDYARAGNVRVAIVYQRNSAAAPCDDTDASHLAHFGLERPLSEVPDPADDRAWKSGELVFQEP